MPKKKSKLDLYIEYCTDLKQEYLRYYRLFTEGGSDPFWEDGGNLNLVRNHIIYHKKNLEELLQDQYWLYPDEYFYPEPLEVPSNLIVKDRICRQVIMVRSPQCPEYKEVLFFDEKLC